MCTLSPHKPPTPWLTNQSSPLPNSLVEQEVGVYLTEFHDQPYCLFEKSWLLENQSTLPPEIKYALIAMTRGRSADSPGMPDQDVSARTFCIEQAWQILSKKYLEGNTDLTFLQGTFLIAQLDLADGKSRRGSASVGLALRVIQSYGLNQGTGLSSRDPDSEAKRRITWAYFMLDRTYNASRSYSLCLADNQFTLPFPSTSTDRTDKSTLRGSLHEGATGQGSKVDQGILACLLRLYSLWGKATEWVFEPLPTSTLPPWQSGSALAILESEWMQFETQFADEHRYMNVEFKRRAREDPDSRPYLSTWLCVQFLFHSIQCLLHHPFVTMVKLRHLSGNLSATFLQKSFETSLLHSRWIARFIREMAEVDFKLCDPFFGYLAAIAATIQLEHTGNKNPKIALLLNGEYKVLVNFIKGLSSQWDSMRVLVGLIGLLATIPTNKYQLGRLNELASRHQNYGSLFYNQDGFSGELSNMATPSNLPRMSTEDETLMWNILDLTSFASPETEPLAETVTRGTSWYETVLESDSAMAAPSHTTPRHHGEPPMPVGATPEWSLSPRANYALPIGVPDIPDWMIFGDFMNEHL